MASTAREGMIEIAGARLQTRVFAPAVRVRAGAGTPPRVVLLHEGLGSIGLWRGFPQRLADTLGEPVLAYSREGYGHSSPWRTALTPRFMHEQAAIALPALLDAFGIRSPILVGHSDGASIALIHAGEFPQVAGAVVAMAPHLFVEPITVESIADARRRYDCGDLAARFARHHLDGRGTFARWTDAWLDPAFRDWNIEREVARIRVPVLAIQGTGDEYGSMRQIRRIAELGVRAKLLELAECGHSPHLDQPDAVLGAIAAFVADPHA